MRLHFWFSKSVLHFHIHNLYAVAIQNLTKFLGFWYSEELRQPPLQESSELTVSLLKCHPTARTKKYQEAGYRHVHSDKKIISKCRSFFR